MNTITMHNKGLQHSLRPKGQNSCIKGGTLQGNVAALVGSLIYKWNHTMRHSLTFKIMNVLLIFTINHRKKCLNHTLLSPTWMLGINIVYCHSYISNTLHSCVYNIWLTIKTSKSFNGTDYTYSKHDTDIFQGNNPVNRKKKEKKNYKRPLYFEVRKLISFLGLMIMTLEVSWQTNKYQKWKLNERHQFNRQTEGSILWFA